MVFMDFHLIANLFTQIMALLVGNISLQACKRESFQQIIIFHCKCESFPPQIFCRIWYVANSM